MKKSFILFLELLIIAITASAKRLPPPDVQPLEKDGFTYTASFSISNDNSYCFGIIIVKHEKDREYSFALPVYMKKIKPLLETDVQLRFIKELNFIDDFSIKITDEAENIYKYDIKTNKVECITSSINQQQVNDVFENKFADYFETRKTINKNLYEKYQPSVQKIESIDQLLDSAEKVLFSVYGEEKIKHERPYNIKKYMNYYMINGTMPKEMKGGTFEIIINAENSQTVSLIHYK